MTPGLLDQVLANVKESGLYLIEHCEHHDTGAVNDGPVSRKLGVPGIPEDTELKIVSRDIEKARETGVHIHFQHVSTAISFDAIRKAKAEGCQSPVRPRRTIWRCATRTCSNTARWRR